LCRSCEDRNKLCNANRMKWEVIYNLFMDHQEHKQPSSIYCPISSNSLCEPTQTFRKKVRSPGFFRILEEALGL
jgi:hypothetical protein